MGNALVGPPLATLYMLFLMLLPLEKGVNAMWRVKQEQVELGEEGCCI